MVSIIAVNSITVHITVVGAFDYTGPARLFLGPRDLLTAVALS